MNQDELISEIESNSQQQVQPQQQAPIQPQQQTVQPQQTFEQQSQPLPPKAVVPQQKRSWLDIATKISYIVLAIATAFIAIIMIWGSLR